MEHHRNLIQIINIAIETRKMPFKSNNIMCSLNSMYKCKHSYIIYQQSMTYTVLVIIIKKSPSNLFCFHAGAYGIQSLGNGTESGYLCIQSQCCAYDTSNQLHVTSSKIFLAGAKVIKIKFVYLHLYMYIYIILQLHWIFTA